MFGLSALRRGSEAAKNRPQMVKNEVIVRDYSYSIAGWSCNLVSCEGEKKAEKGGFLLFGL